MANAALVRLVRLNPPGKVSLAGAYAWGYTALGMAQQEGDGPDWFHDLDPLDTLFLGTAWPGQFRDAYEFGNARTAWLRLIRATGHWRGIERFVTEVVQASQDHQLPVDDGELMLLVVGRLEAAGLDQRRLPAGLLPATGLADARFVRGPATDVPLPAPAADADALVARLWAGTEVDLPHDGTVADALREGLHLLSNAGLDPRADSAMLLVALYLALVTEDSELREDTGERTRAWALGLPEDSPLAAVIDVLAVAADRGLDPDTVLRHLHGLPAFTQPVPSADRRFTSAPGGALVEVAFDLGFRQVDARDGKILRMDADGAAMLQAQTAAFEAKFGRPPSPDDPVFFDPDADTPRPMPLVGAEAATTAMLRSAGICDAWIYASQHTGGLLPRPDGGFNTDADAAEWGAAVDRYLALHSGQTVDEDAELSKLHTMLVMASIDMAAHHPAFGATLLQRLQASHHSPDSDADLVAEFLTHASASVAAFLHDPATAAAATELARSWSGAAFADRVRAAAHSAGPDVDLDVLLAAAAGHLSSPT